MQVHLMCGTIGLRSISIIASSSKLLSDELPCLLAIYIFPARDGANGFSPKQRYFLVANWLLKETD
jgi:hypothetical protein